MGSIPTHLFCFIKALLFLFQCRVIRVLILALNPIPGINVQVATDGS